MLSPGLLDTIGILEGTDKTSLGNDYLNHYEVLFSEFVDEEFDLIEIGVFNGSSLRMWERFFPRARIVGLDIDPSCKRFEGGRIHVEIGSQSDPNFLSGVLARYRPLIIIDDGSHIAHDIIFSFEFLYPDLREGGFYIVEDTYMHFGPTAKRHQGTAPEPIQSYFCDLAVSKMRQWVEDTSANRFKQRWFHSTDWIGFAKSVISIRKKPPLMTNDQALATAEALIADHPTISPHYAFGMAGVVLARNGPVDRAETMARRAIEGDSRNPRFYRRLSEVLAAQGRLREAAESMGTAAELAPHDAYYWDNLARMQAQLGDDLAACDSMRRAMTAHPSNPHYYYFIGEALLRRGLKAEALIAFERALELAQGTPFLAEWQSRVHRIAHETITSPSIP